MFHGNLLEGFWSDGLLGNTLSFVLVGWDRTEFETRLMHVLTDPLRYPIPFQEARPTPGENALFSHRHSLPCATAVIFQLPTDAAEKVDKAYSV